MKARAEGDLSKLFSVETAAEARVRFLLVADRGGVGSEDGSCEMVLMESLGSQHTMRKDFSFRSRFSFDCSHADALASGYFESYSLLLSSGAGCLSAGFSVSSLPQLQPIFSPLYSLQSRVLILNPLILSRKSDGGYPQAMCTFTSTDLLFLALSPDPSWERD